LNYQQKLINIHNYKNIFLDRDGIINEVIVRESGISSPRKVSEFIFRQDFIEFMRGISDDKLFFVVTNQPEIKRGLLNEEVLLHFHNIINKTFTIKKIIYCPHDDIDKCNCRKPLPGMINAVITEYKLNRSECLFIGDSHKDMLAATAANIEAVLLKTNYNKPFRELPFIDLLVNLL